MATIADALLQGAQDLRDATAAVRGIEARIAAKVAENAGTVTTIISQFNSRPLQEVFYCDEVGGNDANDGKTIDRPKKSLDSLLGALGTQGISVLLLSNALIKLRHTLFTQVTFAGVQKANTPIGYTGVRREVSFLGTALNSPDPFVGSCCAGIFFTAGTLFSQEIDLLLPEVPADLVTRSHITSRAFVDVLLQSPTIRVASAQNSGSLFGSFVGGRLVATVNPILGTGAAGHLFQGIAAGANPNSSWSFSTNVTAG